MVLCLCLLVLSVTSNSLTYGLTGLQDLQTSMNMFPWTSDILHLGIPDLRWRPSQFWDTMWDILPCLYSMNRAMWAVVGWARPRSQAAISLPCNNIVVKLWKL